MTGQDYQSLVLRSYDEMHLLDRIGHRFVIIELQHFIFFGSATQLLDLANALIRDQDPNNLANHVRYILLDFSHVLDVDYSAIRIFDETFRALHENNIEVFVSSLNSKVSTPATLSFFHSLAHGTGQVLRSHEPLNRHPATRPLRIPGANTLSQGAAGWRQVWGCGGARNGPGGRGCGGKNAASR